MNSDRPRLDQIQRWMQSVIMHPGGVTEGAASPEARQHWDISPDALDQVIVPSQALDSAQRLEIYVDAYFERLLECLREEFVATHQALGDELFHAVAFGYLQQHPSRSYTLSQLGARFAGYLAESRLHARGAPEDSPPNWADFVIELASFERTQREVFDGPGIEGHASALSAELAEIPVVQRGDVQLTAAPCLRVCSYRHAVDIYWLAACDGRPLPAIEPHERRLAIHRRGFLIERHELSPVQFLLLEALVAGQSLAAALEATATAVAPDDGAWQGELGGWFRDWAALQFFTARAFGPCHGQTA
jgi:hypothetical protein